MKQWIDYRIKRWPIHQNGRFDHFEYNPQYYDVEEEQWRPFTIAKKNEAGYDTMEVRLYPSRMEAEQYIEIMILKDKRNGILSH